MAVNKRTNLIESFVEIVVFGGRLFVEVNGDRKLPALNADEGGRDRKQHLVAVDSHGCGGLCVLE